MPNFYKWDGDDLLLSVYLQPNAKKDEFVGEYGDSLKIRITALPVENKANKHLIKFLAKSFAVSVSQVKLVSGEKARRKRVKILAPHKLPSLIMPATR